MIAPVGPEEKGYAEEYKKWEYKLPSISGIPGAPFGPWYRKTTTVPGLTSPFSKAG